MSPSASEDERDLIDNTATVLRITHGFNARQRQALERCIRLMADGMSHYQESNVKNGLQDQSDMDKYCYYVAGVVGEMLTELFCDYSEEINQHYDELMSLAVSFGQGLQMTIPQLPENLSSVVSNAYLLCRIADTIEDDKDMVFADKKSFAERFIDVVAATAAAESFARDLHPLLSHSASEDERDLIDNTAT